jgi:hypothetical protein
MTSYVACTGLTYAERNLLRSYLCPDIREGSEQVSRRCDRGVAIGLTPFGVNADVFVRTVV